MKGLSRATSCPESCFLVSDCWEGEWQERIRATDIRRGRGHREGSWGETLRRWANQARRGEGEEGEPSVAPELLAWERQGTGEGCV